MSNLFLNVKNFDINAFRKSTSKCVCNFCRRKFFEAFKKNEQRQIQIANQNSIFQKNNHGLVLKLSKDSKRAVKFKPEVNRCNKTSLQSRLYTIDQLQPQITKAETKITEVCDGYCCQHTAKMLA